GLPDFAKEEDFADPKWQRSEPDSQCYPPHKNDYIKTEETDPETGDPIYTLGRTYQIFWRGGGDGYPPDDMTASAIKAGQGDTPGDDGIFWNAIPNEEYELTIRHDLYRFPDFYRTDEKDDNGNYKGNLLSGPPELRDLNGDRIEYTDIRDVPFANISKGNLSIHAQTPYIAGCDCTQLIHVLDGGDGINNDPLADINLNYLAGIKGSTMTETITANSSEVENLNFCGGFEHIRTIGFDDILPMTTFGINGINF
ncbi:uncharacterized protein METZ01_LOCUS455777, partial [marine metagenome]